MKQLYCPRCKTIQPVKWNNTCTICGLYIIDPKW